MTRPIIGLLAAALAALMPSTQARSAQIAPFGEVRVVKPAGPINTVAIVLSGEDGWTDNMDRIATMLAGGDSLVIGIDAGVYLRDLESDHPRDCINPVPPMIDLVKSVERDNGISGYIEPMIVGYSLGATLAYASIAAAPPLTFKGGTGLAFCPTIFPDRPLCSGSKDAQGGKMSLAPVAALPSPFSAVVGEKDTLCDRDAVAAFIAQTNNADLITVPGMGHEIPPGKEWEASFLDAYGAIAGADSQFKSAADDPAIADLPLTEVTGENPQQGEVMVLFLSGDGGWADLDQGVAEALAQQGLPVVGLSSLKYFWTQRTPESTAQDMARVLRHYFAAWHKKKVLIAGYSFGADVAGFLANELPSSLKSRVAGIGLVSPSHSASFEFHLSEWVADSSDGLPTLPQLQKIASGTLIACIDGSEETDSLCPDLASLPNARVHQLEGGHHLGGKYAEIAGFIAQSVQR
jgi:type IV secretory pathway VirJ component